MLKIPKLFIIKYIVFIVFAQSILGQNVYKAESINLKVLKADSLFNARQFEKAIPEYSRLIEEFPQEPDFHYKIGVSYLQSSKNIEKAIYHLKFASSREVPNLVYFYLGNAYHNSYLFDEAISYYRRFSINGGDESIAPETVERLVSLSENGIFMLKYVYEPNVLDSKRLAIKEFHPFISTKPENGSFIPTPKDLKTPTDLKSESNNIIFYPSNPQPGDKIVYSSFGSTTSFGKDLYIIEMLSDGYWSKPKDIGSEINTDFDEDYPYLAPDGVTLYFASNGHYSMGGFDVYKSVYNPITRKWSTPENIGFPFSSPFDDIMFIPDKNEEMAIVVTNRNTTVDSVDLVLIKIDPNPIRRSINSNEIIKNIAKLTPVNTDKVNALKPSSNANEKSLKNTSLKAASFSAVENDPEYSRALALGFSEQMKADSLRIRLEKLRAQFDFVYTADDRISLEKRVVSVEDALLAAQRNADIHFARASQIEQEFLSGKRKPADKPTSTFATDKPEFLYQAQFAATVFQPDELNRLAQFERSKSQIEKLRSEVLSFREKVLELERSSSDSTFNDSDYKLLYSNYLNRLKSFNDLISIQVAGKKKLYNDCISVALMKSNANSNLEVKGEIDRANSHFRSATAIRNNISDETKVESEFEALLLEELGIQRLEIAFSKLWGMKLFEQQLLSNLFRLEQIIFGKTLPEVQSARPKVDTTVINSNLESNISITKVDTFKVQTETFVFQPDKEPSFQVLEKSPYSESNPIPSHEPIPGGVIYKIQLAAYSNPIKIEIFKGMVPITAEPINGGNVTKYYAGIFDNFSDAESALPIVRSKGFKDAFIVSWHNGRSIPPSRAKSLENSIPLNQQKDSVKIEIVSNDKLFVIQLGNYNGRIPEDVTQTIRALAPGKDIIRKPDGRGGFIYSVASYTDLSEATRVKDNLVTSGIKNAFVVALDMDN